MNTETVAQRIRIARRHARLSQTRLGEMIGVNQARISQWETGRDPRTKTLASIAVALRVSLLWLATGEGERDVA